MNMLETSGQKIAKPKDRRYKAELLWAAGPLAPTLPWFLVARLCPEASWALQAIHQLIVTQEDTIMTTIQGCQEWCARK